MPSFVYSCEKCSTELRFLVSFALDENISIHCPKCNEVKKFQMEREGNVGKDWCSNVSIKNKRRRDEDGLYKSPAREQVLASWEKSSVSIGSGVITAQAKQVHVMIKCVFYRDNVHHFSLIGDSYMSGIFVSHVFCSFKNMVIYVQGIKRLAHDLRYGSG